MTNLILTSIVLVFASVYGLLTTQVKKLTTRYIHTVALPIAVIVCCLFPFVPFVLVVCGIVVALALRLGITFTTSPMLKLKAPLLTEEEEDDSRFEWTDDDEEVGNMDQFAELS